MLRNSHNPAGMQVPMLTSSRMSANGELATDVEGNGSHSDLDALTSCILMTY